MFDRRQFLAGAAGAAGALALPLQAAPRGEGLGAIAAASGIRFGSTVGKGNFADIAYRALNARECTLIVPENELKWSITRPSATTFDFGPADALIGWATRNGLGVRGHTLLWHSERWTPKWVTEHDFGAQPARAAERLLQEHVTRVAGRYARVIDSFDVVNEAIDSDTGVLRETALSKAMGGAQQTLDLAFHSARAAAPSAELVYNDYMGWRGDEAVHRTAVLKLLEGFRKRNVPVDALGVQSHLGSKYSDSPTGLGALDETAWRKFLDEVTAMGFRLLITEMDVHDNPLPSDIAKRDAEVAAHTRAYLDLMLSYPQCRTVMCWGLSDRYSWLNDFRPRPDALPKRPLPFDAEFRPKPMRDALAAAFEAHPRKR